jgi:hypothetical protein
MLSLRSKREIKRKVRKLKRGLQGSASVQTLMKGQSPSRTLGKASQLLLGMLENATQIL